MRNSNLLLGGGLGGGGRGGGGSNSSTGGSLLGLGLCSLGLISHLLHGGSGLGVHARNAGVTLLLALGTAGLGLRLELLLAHLLGLGLVDELDKETLVLEHATLALHVEVVVPEHGAVSDVRCETYVGEGGGTCACRSSWTRGTYAASDEEHAGVSSREPDRSD